VPAFQCPEVVLNQCLLPRFTPLLLVVLHRCHRRVCMFGDAMFLFLADPATHAVPYCRCQTAPFLSGRESNQPVHDAALGLGRRSGLCSANFSLPACGRAMPVRAKGCALRSWAHFKHIVSMCALLRGFEQKMALLNFDKCSNDFPFREMLSILFPKAGTIFIYFLELN